MQLATRGVRARARAPELNGSCAFGAVVQFSAGASDQKVGREHMLVGPSVPPLGWELTASRMKIPATAFR
ncbi:hypothetical protein SBBP2_2240005 [Burkholderiales bacterium]|nr:hypothetical protein SBBP2_2240005 [Burkholderiales bacterium]